MERPPFFLKNGFGKPFAVWNTVILISDEILSFDTLS